MQYQWQSFGIDWWRQWAARHQQANIKCKNKKCKIKNRRTSQKTRMIADDEMERKRRNILSKQRQLQWFQDRFWFSKSCDRIVQKLDFCVWPHHHLCQELISWVRLGWNIWGSGGFDWVHEVVICSTSGSHFALIGGCSGQSDNNKQT